MVERPVHDSAEKGYLLLPLDFGSVRPVAVFSVSVGQPVVCGVVSFSLSPPLLLLLLLLFPLLLLLLRRPLSESGHFSRDHLQN